MFDESLRDSSVVNLGLNHFAAAQAGSADADALGGALYPSPNGAEVHVPASAREVVRVADGISRQRFLAADITNLCHGLLQMSSDVSVQTIDFIGREAVSTTEPEPRCCSLVRKRAKRALLCRKERDTSRGSPRSLAAQMRLARDDNQNGRARERNAAQKPASVRIRDEAS